MHFITKLEAHEALTELTEDTTATSLAGVDAITATPVAAGVAVVTSAVAAYAVTDAID